MAWRAPIGDAFVDGSSYGDERRFLLRTPGALAIGPLFVVCAVIVAGLTVGPVLLLAQRWVVGAILLGITCSRRPPRQTRCSTLSWRFSKSRYVVTMSPK